MTAFKLWAESFGNKSLWPPWWQPGWGRPVELWKLEEDPLHNVVLLMTKPTIVQGVTENMHGRLPVYHVWNIHADKHVYAGQDMQVVYEVFRTEKGKL